MLERLRESGRRKDSTGYTVEEQQRKEMMDGEEFVWLYGLNDRKTPPKKNYKV